MRECQRNGKWTSSRAGWEPQVTGAPGLALVPDSKVCARARRLIPDRQRKLAKISNQQSSINNLIVSEQVAQVRPRSGCRGPAPAHAVSSRTVSVSWQKSAINNHQSKIINLTVSARVAQLRPRSGCRGLRPRTPSHP
jgi:hypothetical protein